MVKRQKEKQYNSAREQRAYSQIRSGAALGSSRSSVQRRLPFSHCALTLTPYETPVCTVSGIVFENSAILPFLMKHKMDPVTGTSMTSRDLIRLAMDKDEEGRWQCPVLTKPFSDTTKIIAIRRGNEANVYSFEAYQELNVKAKNYEDLISGEKFDKTKDVLVLNDPDDDDFNQRRDINTFYHVSHARELEKDKVNETVRFSKTASRVMEQLHKKQDEEKAAMKRSAPDNDKAGKKLKILASDVTGVAYTTGKASSSYTSTAVELHSESATRDATEEEILRSQFDVMRKLKRKGYVKLRTNKGDMTIELHCDIVPRTCTNFLGLCRVRRYDNTKFHRLITNFMIQGGKSDDEDRSLWGDAFVDEFDNRLTHSNAGVVSMANSGPHSNKQQFFITFKSCSHLDRKHSVFGQVVKGMDVLATLEAIPTDKKERPKEEITILGTEILDDPAEEARLMEQTRFEALAAAREQNKISKSSSGLASSGIARPRAPKSSSPSLDVGRYLNDRLKKSQQVDEGDDVTAIPTLPSRLVTTKAPTKTGFHDFSGW